MKKNLLCCAIYWKQLVLLLLLSFCSTAAFSQALNVSGTVIDSLDESAVPAVTIRVAGTNKITQTDEYGKYSVIAAPGAELIFTSQGYNEKRVIVRNQAIINVDLVFSKKELREVTVVAFAKQKKATVTGAISSVNTKEIKQSPAANLAVSLAGRLPGLTTQQTSGEPGRDLTAMFPARPCND